MAQAKLVAVNPPNDRDIRSWFALSTDLQSFVEFDGPPDRDWANFGVHSGDAASYSWRTPAERVLDIAHRVRRGRLSAAQAATGFGVRDYLVRLETYAADGSKPRAQLLLDIAAGKFDPRSWGHLGYYDPEDDEHVADAARALPAPPWMRWHWEELNGPSSPDDLCLVLDTGYGLRELAGYLEHLAAGPTLHVVREAR